MDWKETDDLSASKSLLLYPNPVTDNLNITGYIADEGVILSIFNWTGSLIEQVNFEKGAIKNVLSTKDWPAGIYYYSTNEKDAQTHKLVVTH